MAKKKLQGLKRIAILTAATATRRTNKGEGQALMLMVPRETLQALKVKAAEQSTTSRALVLEALRKSGYPVPSDELTDRRRRA